MYKLMRLTLTVLLVVAVAVTSVAAAKKPVTKKPVIKAVAVKVPSGPKLLTVVAGQPFEKPLSGGPAKISVTLCPEETEPATFTVRYNKSLSDIRVAASDLIGPGKIGKENLNVSLVQGDDLTSAECLTIDSTAKQIWVGVTVPKGTKPGIYKGYIGFYAQGKQMDVEPIDVTVRPLRLIGSSKQYALYTSLCPDAPGVCGLSCEAYNQFLSGVTKMGFRSASVCSEPTKISEALNACAASGLMGSAPVLTFASGTCIPSMDDIRAVESARKAAGISTAFYFCASNPEGEDDVQAACDKLSILHQAGVRVAATIASDAAVQKLMPGLDAVNYRIDMPYVQALINGGTNRTNKWEWYWWDGRESVSDNRINAGIALWRSGLYGCMPYWMPKDVTDKPNNLDSLLCEALREGVDDTRYITTYMKALRELKDKKRGSDKDYIASTETYLSMFLSKPLDKLTPADLRVFRAKMAEFSIKLTTML